MLRKENVILFVVRSDAQYKNGGDYQLAQSYSQEIGHHFHTEIIYGVPRDVELARADLVICTNLDRPLEGYATLTACKRRGIPFILYALHHPNPGVETYLRHGTRGLKKAIAFAVGFQPQQYEMGLWLLRVLATAFRRRRILPIASVARAQKALVKDANAIVVCSAREIEQIQADVADIPCAYVVPHMPDFPAPTNVQIQPNLIVIPGRIEARKNQLMALKVAKHFPKLSFLFVGAPSQSERRYVAEFMTELTETPNTHYVTELPKEEFYSMLSSAEVVLNASFFEVTSLIDLYCIANSIPLVTTVHSYLRASGAFRTCDPTSAEDGARSLQECLDVARIDGRKIVAVAEPRTLTLMDVIERVL